MQGEFGYIKTLELKIMDFHGPKNGKRKGNIPSNQSQAQLYKESIQFGDK